MFLHPKTPLPHLCDYSPRDKPSVGCGYRLLTLGSKMLVFEFHCCPQGKDLPSLHIYVLLRGSIAIGRVKGERGVGGGEMSKVYARMSTTHTHTKTFTHIHANTFKNRRAYRYYYTHTSHNTLIKHTNTQIPLITPLLR